MPTQTLLIVQARMSSERLPGKVALKILDKPLLEYLLERVKHANRVDQIVVATTTAPHDDVIEQIAHSCAVETFRGSKEDVLKRFVDAATPYSPNTIIRICGDCPLIDPQVIDAVIGRFTPPLDYASNTLVRSYPRGMDIEVFTLDALLKAHRYADKKYMREHVTPYIYEHPEFFSSENVSAEKDHASYRLCVDTKEDFLLVSKIIEALYPRNQNFSLDDIVQLLHRHPQWLTINAAVQQKQLF